LENNLKFKKVQLDLKNKMMARRIKTIMNKEREGQTSNCKDD